MVATVISIRICDSKIECHLNLNGKKQENKWDEPKSKKIFQAVLVWHLTSNDAHTFRALQFNKCNAVQFQLSQKAIIQINFSFFLIKQ